MKKCLLLIPRMCSGGAERVMATIANNLCKENQVKIVTMTDAESFYKLDDRVSVIGLGQNANRKNKITKVFSALSGGLKSYKALKKMIKDWKPDVLLAFLGPANILAVMLKIFGVKCRVIVSERCDPTTRGRLYRWFERRFFPKVDKVICQSNGAASFFSKKARKKIAVIPNPISADAIPLRFEGERRKTVIGVGRLDKQKNFKMLINAFSKLDERFNDFTLEIYGGGLLENDLNEHIKSLGLEKRAYLMGVKSGVMHHVSDVALFVMSSNYEGFPNALVEAMATGLPVISTDFSTGVAREIIKDENGIIIPVGDENALVSAMQEILSNPERWEKMSIKNREMLETLSEANVMRIWEETLFNK